MKLAVILPSRGLIFSQTIEEVLTELQDYDYKIFFSHSKPIPDCFNQPLELALAGNYDYIWFVEEDMALPRGVLAELLTLQADIATIDYPATEGVMCLQRDATGAILYTGTGCLLVKRSVFDKMAKPIFDTSFAYTVDGQLIGQRNTTDMSHLYGQQDVHFFLQARSLNLSIAAAGRTAKQRKIVNYGAPGTNNGFHTIKLI